MINSRALSDLNNATRTRATAFKSACAEAGIDVLIYCTYRDFEQQAAIYAIGRDKKGNVINSKLIQTKSKPGESWHNWRCAFDCVGMIGGKPQWKDKELYARMGVIGEKVGLEWAGRWTGDFRETCHFQYTGGYTIADYQSGKVQIA